MRAAHGRRDAPATGVSSITFWWRRCTEHSRSKRCTVWPWASAKTWTLDVAGPLDEALDVQRADRRTRPGPRAAPRRAPAAARRGCRTVFMPMPPPPAAALTSSGAPSAARGRRLSASVDSGPRGAAPGTTGTPAASISARAPIFEPMRAMASAVGPDEDEAGVLARLWRSAAVPTGSRSRDARRRRRWPRAASMRAATFEVALGRGRRPDAHGAIGRLHVRRAGVGIGVHGHASRCPSSRQARMTRSAISPRLAISTRRDQLSAQPSRRAPAWRGTPAGPSWPSGDTRWAAMVRPR